MSLMDVIRAEKDAYLDEQRTAGGTARGFCLRVLDKLRDDPERETYAEAAYAAAAYRGWREVSDDDEGEDLFSVAGVTVAVSLTRTVEYVDDKGRMKTRYEQVSRRWATVNDAILNLQVKRGKTEDSINATARLEMQVSEMEARAAGDLSMFLRDLADR